MSNDINTDKLQSLIHFIRKEEQHIFTVLILGHIFYQKNPALINQVVETMLDVRFLWIDDGELREALKAPDIEITGWGEREKSSRHSLVRDVFVLTCLWDGLSRSLLEAMYMKKLCVVSDVIQNEENVFDCHEIDELIHAINEAQTDDVVELMNSANQNIVDKYNMSVMAEKYSVFYMDKLTAKIMCGGVQHKVILIGVCFEAAATTDSYRKAVAA